MEFNLYSIRDVLNGFGYPFCLKSDDVALRTFEMMKRDPNSLVSKSPEDFQLFSVGTYNTETGLIESWFPRPVVAKNNNERNDNSNA